MDTYTNPEPTTSEPMPARDGRDAPSRLRVLATSVAVAGLTATGGLAVILSTAATGGNGAATAANANGAPNPPSLATTAPDASTAPDAQGGTQAQPQNGAFGPGRPNGQPPQFGQGTGPGHATTGGS